MAQNHILFDGRKMAAYELTGSLCKDYGFEVSFAETLWDGLLRLPLLYDEFVHYMQTGELTGLYLCEGVSMYDLYFYHLRRYNVTHDLGRNMPDCDKERLVFQAFHTMVLLTDDPVTYLARLSAAQGMDSTV